MIGRFLAVGFLMALAGARVAHADAVAAAFSSDETVFGPGQADTFEITCKHNSVSLCVRSDDRGTPDDPMFVSLVGTSPTIMLGATAVTEIDAGQIDSVCLNARGNPSSMKALATFTARHDAKFPATYTITAICLGDIGQTNPIKVKVKQRGTPF